MLTFSYKHCNNLLLALNFDKSVKAIFHHNIHNFNHCQRIKKKISRKVHNGLESWQTKNLDFYCTGGKKKPRHFSKYIMFHRKKESHSDLERHEGEQINNDK